MIHAIRHTGLVVADLDRALYFWRDILGLRVERQMEESGPHIDAMMGLEGVRVTTVKLATPDGNLVELLHFHSHPDKSDPEGYPYSSGFRHLALTVENLDEFLPRLIAAGAKVPADPQFSPDGKVKAIYVTGPEGILLELVQVIER